MWYFYDINMKRRADMSPSAVCQRRYNQAFRASIVPVSTSTSVSTPGLESPLV